jgi:hypothetical protein
MIWLAIDPGPTESGYVIWNGVGVLESGHLANALLRTRMGCPYVGKNVAHIGNLVIEMVASYGMAVGASVFETCVAIGRFQQSWDAETSTKAPAELMYRRIVKLHLCGSTKAKDTNIRQALIDRFGPVGTKKNPGPLFGVSGHAWAALALAVTAADRAAGRLGVAA